MLRLMRLRLGLRLRLLVRMGMGRRRLWMLLVLMRMMGDRLAIVQRAITGRLCCKRMHGRVLRLVEGGPRVVRRQDHEFRLTVPGSGGAVGKAIRHDRRRGRHGSI